MTIYLRYRPVGLICQFFASTITAMKKHTKVKQGRPRKPPDKLKGELLQVRLETAEKQRFAEAAGLVGQELSVWVRDQLRRATRQTFAEFGRNDPFIAGVSEIGSLE